MYKAACLSVTMEAWHDLLAKGDTADGPPIDPFGHIRGCHKGRATGQPVPYVSRLKGQMMSN